MRLLKWVQKTLPHYNITGFSKDWYDGRAFGALIEACFPDVFINWAQQDSRSPKEYIDVLQRTAKRKLGIDPLFKSSDLTEGKVEEMQIMTTVMQIRNGNAVSLPDEVVVRGQGIKAAYLQKETSFVVDTNEAGPGELLIDAYYEDDGRKLKFTLVEKTKQAYCLTYTPLSTSNIIFNILWSDQPIPHSPFTVPVTDATLVSIIDFASHNTLVEVGKPLSLHFEAKKAGQGQLSGYLQYGKERVSALATNLPNRSIRLDYTPTKPGKPVLHVFWNKEELQHLAVTYTVVDIGGYSIRSLPKNRVYCTFEEPEFCIVSEKGLPLSVLQMTAVLSLDVQIPIKFKSVDGNLGYASFTPTLPGEYRVEIVCVDQLIKGCPFSVKVTDPHNCKMKNDVPSFLEVAKPHTFEIDAQDAGGFGEISFDSSDHDISSLFKTRLKPRLQSSSVQKLEVTPLKEGDFLVGIKYQNQWIANSPFRVQICNPTKFEVVDKLKLTNVGQPIEFKVRGKERCDGSLKPVFKATGPSAKYSPVVQLSEDGLCYSVKFSPWEIGEHEISITYGGFDIPRSPIKIPVVSFDSDACSAAGSGLQKAYTNIPAQFVIKGKERGLLEDGTLKIKITSVVDGSECRIRARDNKDGSYSIAYLIQKPGAYLISVQTAGQHIPGSPFRLNALLGPEAHKCRMYGPALEEETILMFGKPIDFTVDTVKAGAGKLTVKAIGPDGAPARVFIAKNEQPGKYDISIETFRHGKHRVSVKWSGRHIPESPFTIKIFPGADARRCLAYGPGLEDGEVGKKSSFTIETKNAGAGLLRVRLHGLKGAFKIQIGPVDQQNRRTLLANYNPQLPGEYLITIKWSEIHIPGSPFRVKMLGDAANGHHMPLIFMPTPPVSDLGTFEELEDDDLLSDLEASSSDRISGSSAPSVISSKADRERPSSSHLYSRNGTTECTPDPPTPVMLPTFKNDVKREQNQKMVTFSNVNSVRTPRTRAVRGRKRVASKKRAKARPRRSSEEYSGHVTVSKRTNMSRSKH